MLFRSDALATIQSSLPKDLSNITTGVSTHGLSEFLTFYNDTIFHFWMTLANGNVGYFGGLVIVSLVYRMIFFPASLYSQLIGYKMKLMRLDMEEFTANIKRY